MEQTPWEVLKSFFKKYDDAEGDYDDIKIEYKEDFITLRNHEGKVVLVRGPELLEKEIRAGKIKQEACILERVKKYGKTVCLMSAKGIATDAKEIYLKFEFSNFLGGLEMSCELSNGITFLENEEMEHIVYRGDYYNSDHPDTDLQRINIQERFSKNEIKMSMNKS